MSDKTEINVTPSGSAASPTAKDLLSGTRSSGRPGPGHGFGDYEILMEIARGGMGVVYRARQLTLDRTVALKMILSGRLADRDDVTRFHSEASAAARLQHPNIVSVYQVGEVDGQHYFAMEFIEGQSLDHRLANGPMAGRQAARYLHILARAVHYAHEHGIVHRDLKPSNILIDRFDEPHITDFGLAKQMGSGHPGQTRTGTIMGTPGYMSPEQAQGRTRDIGPASDIYSLGAILYELLTGRPPFQAETPYDTVMQVIDHHPVPPRLLNPNVDADLETICLKCLEKDPKLRYATAEQMGLDLQHYLEGESIEAHSFNMLDRLTRMLDRSVHTENFSTWSNMLLGMAGIVAVEHLVVFALIQTGQSYPLILAARLLQIVLLGLLFWYHRRHRLLPTNSAERELWSIWIGYFASYGVILVTTRLLLRYGVISSSISEHAAELLPYPFLATTAGLAFFTMGSNYWGRCYAIGLAFFAIAAVIPFHLDWAPLEFGLLWAISLVWVSRHLRQQTLSSISFPPPANVSTNVTTVALHPKNRPNPKESA